MKEKPDIIYICRGYGAPCYMEPGCVYRHDPVGPMDMVCNHIMQPEFALNGSTNAPEMFPERFIFQERPEGCGPSYYWEED